MAEFPYFPLWTDAYLGDTTHLTTIEHGAYLLLLISMWRTQDKSLPNDDARLAKYVRLTPGQWKRIKPEVMRFFEVDGDVIFQGRLRDEAAIVKRRSNRQSHAAKARWSDRSDTFNAAAVKRDRISDALDDDPKSLKNQDSVDATAVPRQSRGNASISTSTSISTVKVNIYIDDVEKFRELAVENGKDVTLEYERFTDYCLSNGKRYKSYEAAFRNWLRSHIGEKKDGKAHDAALESLAGTDFS